MELCQEQGRNVVYGDHEDWETVETSITEATRWSICKIGVFKHLPTGRFYSMFWSKAATEMQDEQPFEYAKPNLTEVHQVEKLVKKWVRV